KNCIIILWMNILGLNFSQARDVNLLTSTYTIQGVEQCLAIDNDWVAYPDYKDREAWKQLVGPFYEELLKEGDKYLNYQWRVVKATDYLEYERSGSRVIMEKPLNEN